MAGSIARPQGKWWCICRRCQSCCGCCIAKENPPRRHGVTEKKPGRRRFAQTSADRKSSKDYRWLFSRSIHGSRRERHEVKIQRTLSEAACLYARKTVAKEDCRQEDKL